MKITVVALEIPFPPNHGGRVDIWRRLQVLSALGVSIQLVCWSKGELQEDIKCALMEVVETLHLLRFNGTSISSLAKRISFLPRYPLEISSRIVYGENLKKLRSAVEAFHPDLIMIDQLHGCMVGRYLHNHLGVPLVLRSHNIEHLYYKNLYASAQGIRKILRLLSLNGLERIEKATLKECDAFYDISVDDLGYWQSQGFANGKFLPPLINPSDMDYLASLASSKDAKEIGASKSFDVVFLGNLYTDNNVAGIVWFLSEVVPRLKSKIPDIKILISGSNPVKKIVDLCESSDCVTLQANPESASDIYRSGRVLINPMAVGGGVSIKAIDMLATGCPIVTLPKGVGGLPEPAKSLFHIAESADDFAEKICLCLGETNQGIANYELLDSLFGMEPMKAFLQDIKENILSIKAL